jgi:TRAP-type C4-dicarboxylate transport system substrate-binding protein
VTDEVKGWVRILFSLTICVARTGDVKWRFYGAMRKRGILIILAVGLVAGIILSGCGQQKTQAPKEGQSAQEAKPITLKYAFFAPANTFPAKQMDKWAEEVEKRTNGKVKVEKFPGGTLLTAQNMYDGVLKRVADIGLSCPSYEPGRFPLTGISDQPVAYPTLKIN